MNKKIKKLILIIVAAFLATTLVIFTALGAIKHIKTHIGDTVISLEDKTALTGDTVKIPIVIEKNHGLWGGQIKINYNANVLDFISCANGDVFDECEVNDTDGSVNLLVNQSEMNNSKINGTIATLNFKIKETAKKGNSEIVFDQSSNFCDKNSDLIEPILENGIITVK